MILNTITYVNQKDPDHLIKRNITSIFGIPFYSSSGTFSNYPQTWFPFFGIQEVDRGIYKAGYYIKPFLPLMEKPASALLIQYFPNNPYFKTNLQQRFGSALGLLLSSWLGGGLWDTDQGKLLKQKLIEQYPHFYSHLPQPKLQQKSETFDVKEVNSWLCKAADVKKIDELEHKMPKLQELIDRFKPKPPVLHLLYQVNKSNLGSVMDKDGHRRSARLRKG